MILLVGGAVFSITANNDFHEINKEKWDDSSKETERISKKICDT